MCLGHPDPMNIIAQSIDDQIYYGAGVVQADGEIKTAARFRLAGGIHCFGHHQHLAKLGVTKISSLVIVNRSRQIEQAKERCTNCAATGEHVTLKRTTRIEIAVIDFDPVPIAEGIDILEFVEARRRCNLRTQIS